MNGLLSRKTFVVSKFVAVLLIVLATVSSNSGEDSSSASVIGVLSCIRQLMPQLARPATEDQVIVDSFSTPADDSTVSEPMPSLSPISNRQIVQV